MVENSRRADISISEIAGQEAEDLESLDIVLTKFEAKYPDRAKLIKLRFFAGLSEQEAAAILGISRATASRYWTFGKTWLYKEMKCT